MVHLRIVAPPEHASRVLTLFEHNHAVCHVVHIEGAATKPPGDLVLADVAREDASVILADLRELGVPAVGSVSLVDVDTQLSEAAERAERAAPGLPSDAVVWEEVEASTSESTELSVSFLAFMALAMLIAAVGILTDQLILIIGAMVVGPEFGPLAGLCVAIVERRGALARRSLLALAVGFPLGIAITFAMTLLLRAAGVAAPGADGVTSFISHPDELSFLVAFLAGTAGTLSLTSAKSGALVGVLISVTTIPAAADIAVALAYGRGADLAGASEQLGLNLAAIVIAGTGTLMIQRGWFESRRRRHRASPGRAAAGLEDEK